MNETSPGTPAARYDASTIQVIDGMEAVRRRPAMYLGDIHDGSGLASTILGFVVNALEEHRRGRCQHVAVTYRASGAVTVQDDGPGIPTAFVAGTPFLEAVFTKLHIQPVGHYRQTLSAFFAPLAVASAVARDLWVDVVRDDRLHELHCSRGRLVKARTSPANGRPTGTRITFVPDPLIFTSTQFDTASIEAELRDLAFLNPGFTIEIADQRPGGSAKSLRTAGLGDWVARITEGQRGVPAEPLLCRGWARGIEVQAALRWTWTPVTRIQSFVNQRRTLDGAHVWGLFAGVGRALRTALKSRRPAAAPVRLRPHALAHGLAAVVAIEHPDPRFCSARRCIHDDDSLQAVKEVVARDLSSALGSRTLDDLLQHLPPVHRR
jgi:DNA gyrase subunit B